MGNRNNKVYGEQILFGTKVDPLDIEEVENPPIENPPIESYPIESPPIESPPIETPPTNQEETVEVMNKPTAEATAYMMARFRKTRARKRGYTKIDQQKPKVEAPLQLQDVDDAEIEDLAGHDLPQPVILSKESAVSPNQITEEERRQKVIESDIQVCDLDDDDLLIVEDGAEASSEKPGIIPVPKIVVIESTPSPSK